MKTGLSEAQVEAKEPKAISKRGNVHCDWFILLLLLPTLTIWFSLDHKRNTSDGVVRGVGRKWKRSDSSDSVSIMLTTLLTTRTPSLVKTRLNIMCIIRMLIFFRYLRGREA